MDRRIELAENALERARCRLTHLEGELERLRASAEAASPQDLADTEWVVEDQRYEVRRLELELEAAK